MQYATRRALSAENFGLPQKLPWVGDALQPRAVGVHEIDVRELQVLPAAAAHRHRAAAIGGERDPFAVGRPRRPEVAAGPRRQRLRLLRLQIHRPQIGRAAVASRDEHELFAVGRERGLIVVGGTIGQALEAGAVGFDAKEIGGSFAVRCEDDRSAVGRPDRVVVDLRRGPRADARCCRPRRR